MIREPVLDVICSLYPNIQPLVWLNPHLASVSIPEYGTIPLFIDDLCQICPLAFSKVLFIATMYGSIILSDKNRLVMAAILALISVDIALRRLSNVRLLGIWVRPQLFIIFLL